MKNFLNNTKIKTRDWILKHAHGVNARWWLFVISFSESSFLVLPTDTFLVAILMAGAQRWIYYSGLTTVASVLGGVFGYFIGFSLFDLFGEKIIMAYGLEKEIARAAIWYDQNAFWSIFAAGLLPIIPYKVFTLSAGVLKVNFMVFIIASIASRGLRFFIVGYTVKVFGPKMGQILFKYFNSITAIVLILFISIFILIS